MVGKPPISRLDAHVGFWLRFVSNHVSAEFRKAVEAQGVSLSEWVALRQLFDAGEASASDLMASLGMTKGAVSKIVTRLETGGLAQRVMDKVDRRAQRIVLTKAGRALVPTLAAIADRNDEDFFGHLDASRRRALVSLMKQVVELRQLSGVPID